jgi:hypothetical protein
MKWDHLLFGSDAESASVIELDWDLVQGCLSTLSTFVACTDELGTQ